MAGTVRVSDSITVGDTVFVVNSKSGNVGIGTTTPASKLDVAGTVTATSFSGSGSGLTGVTASSLSPANLTSTIATDSIANGAVTSAKLTGSVNVTDSLVVGDTRLVVLKSGNVGVGTTSPNERLVVKSTAGAYTAANVEHGSGTGKAIVGFLNPDRTWSAGLRGDAGDAFSIADESAAAHRLFIDTSGNVGIGNTSPGAKLHVTGDVSVSDSLVVGDTRLVVLKSGNVGIGTTSPASKLDVAGTVTATAFKFPDGTTQTTASRGKQMFTASGSFTVPAGVTTVERVKKSKICDIATRRGGI